MTQANHDIQFFLLTGISGAGKSVALKYLEDAGYACVDNLPITLLDHFVDVSIKTRAQRVAVAIDARSPGNLRTLPDILRRHLSRGVPIQVLFLDADDNTLIQRYSESRRRHPLSERLGEDGKPLGLRACIAQERELLAPLRLKEHVIDTTGLTPLQLRHWMQELIGTNRSRVTLTIESFAYKIGPPRDGDLVFDVRCLPNPYYEMALRGLTGRDSLVADWLEQFPEVNDMIDDIEAFVRKWLPRYVSDTRAYFTIAVGCTGGQHRSVYVVEQLAQRFADIGDLLIRHRNRPEFS
ncbi:RNase adapter RapZ [Orrella sp. 11846]|uniref:RNase adapter RapZ n=1 Tax=Orrella sp. 11846 TaxID=3409913 RepID=UPI003B5BB593